MVAGGVDAQRRGVRDRVGPEPPDEQRHARDGVPARPAGRVRTADGDGVRELIERPVHAVECVPVTQVGGPATAHPPRVVRRCRSKEPNRCADAEQRGELHGTGRPAGDVGGELFQQGEAALAAVGVNRVRDVGARRDRPGQRRGLRAGRAARARLWAGVRGRMQGNMADEIAEIGDDPVCARLNEPVVVERLDVALDDLHLFVDHLKQGS